MTPNNERFSNLKKGNGNLETNVAFENDNQSQNSGRASNVLNVVEKIDMEVMDKNLDECQKELMEHKEKYMRRRHYKWLVVIGFMFLCSLSIIFFSKMYQFATNSLYDRQPMEDLMDSLIGKRVISEAITDELMITAYDYNSQYGRLFSKSFAKRNPELLDVKFSLATGSSSAAPIFFEP